MADISKIEINNVSYNIKDATARQMIENLPTGGTGSGGDWAQNDPLGDGYIKHRTHWKEEIGGEILLPETTVQFSGSGTTLTSATAAADALAEGDKVSVFWNGTKYVCEAFTYFGYSCLGNASLNNPSAEDTGEPFLFIFQRGGNVTINKKSSAAETITIKVGDKDTIYHKLPGEFLPDGVPYVEKGVLLEETDAVEGTNPMFGKIWEIAKAPKLTAEETYTVIYNGTSYECVCKDLSEMGFTDGSVALGNLSIAGLENTGEPFAVLVNHNIQMVIAVDLTGATSVRIGIMGKVGHKMEELCMPDTARVLVVKFEGTGDGNLVSLSHTYYQMMSALREYIPVVACVHTTGAGAAAYLTSPVYFHSGGVTIPDFRDGETWVHHFEYDTFYLDGNQSNKTIGNELWKKSGTSS